MKPNRSASRLFALCVMGLLMLAGCAQGPEARKPTQAASPSSVAPPVQKAVVPAPVAPAPAAAAAPGSELGTVSGTVTKIGKEMEVLELQTPSGWSQFIITEPAPKKELERIMVGERVDVKVEVRGSDRKVVAVLKRNPR